MACNTPSDMFDCRVMPSNAQLCNQTRVSTAVAAAAPSATCIIWSCFSGSKSSSSCCESSPRSCRSPAICLMRSIRSSTSRFFRLRSCRSSASFCCFSYSNKATASSRVVTTDRVIVTMHRAHKIYKSHECTLVYEANENAKMLW